MKKIRYIPYGYTIRNGRTIIAQEEAAVIREIFDAYIGGASLKSIAEQLTDRRIPYSERTDIWDKARIARIIDNAKYIGDGEYDPIIDEDLYEEAVNLKTARQRNTFEKGCAEISLLRDLVRCEKCGAPMKGASVVNTESEKAGYAVTPIAGRKFESVIHSFWTTSRF